MQFFVHEKFKESGFVSDILHILYEKGSNHSMASLPVTGKNKRERTAVIEPFKMLSTRFSNL